MRTTAPTIAQASDTIKGALLMMASMAGFVINDGFMKFVLKELPLFQTLFLRGTALTIALLVLAHFRGVLRHPLGGRDRRYIGWRCVAEIGATFGFLTALTLMPFANLSAILQVLPLTVTLSAALFLGAPIGWRRMAAILVGFAGVLIIIRPGMEGFNTGALFALMAVGFVTFRDLASRQLSPGVPSIQVALITSVVLTLVGGLGSMTETWNPVSPHLILLMVCAAAFLVVGYVASVAAMRVGDIAVVTPFRYTSLLFAILIGLLIFGEVPDHFTILGASIIVGMGIFTFYREQKLSRTQADTG